MKTQLQSFQHGILTKKIQINGKKKRGRSRGCRSDVISLLHMGLKSRLYFRTSGSVRIVRSCFLDVTTILSLLSLLFSAYQCYQEQDLVA